MPATLIILFIAVAIAAIIYGYHLAAKRREELFTFATQLGMQFDSDPGDWHDRFDAFAPFGQGSSRDSSNLIHGPWNGIEWEMFDYKYETGSGKNRHTHHYGIVAASLPVSLPHLEIRPEGWWDKVAGLVGFEDINFESEAFSRRFHVKCDSRKVAYDIIHPKMIEFLMASTPMHWQIRGTRLVMIRNSHFKPDQLRACMGLIHGFITRIPPYVLHDRGATPPRWPI